QVRRSFARHLRIRPAAWRAKERRTWSWPGRFPRLLLAGIAALTLIGVLVSPLPEFDYNLLHLQAKGTESVVWENRLLEGSDRSSWYALSTADSVAELHRKKAQFAALRVVDKVESLTSILPTDQPERLALLAEMAPVVESISGAWEKVGPIELAAAQYTPARPHHAGRCAQLSSRTLYREEWPLFAANFCPEQYLGT